MSDWKQKRFWKEARAIAHQDGGFGVELDGRAIRTPAKAALVVPSAEMADAIAAEWNAQEGVINPARMPFTRSANAAIDKVRPQHAEVARMIAAYGDADLLCYRAQTPEELVARQAELWDPALEWAQAALGATLRPRGGVMHVPQDPDALATLAARVHAMTPFQLAGFHDLVSLTGSLILGFGAALDWRAPAEIWHLSRLDEIWQQEQWGSDDEEAAREMQRAAAFAHAKRFFDMA